MSFFLGKNKIQKPAIIKKIVNETMHDKVSSRFSESRLSYGTTARQLLDVSNLAKKMSWQKKTCVCCCAWKSSPRQVECGTVNHALS